jgi:hypothetical protein
LSGNNRQHPDRFRWPRTGHASLVYASKMLRTPALLLVLAFLGGCNRSNSPYPSAPGDSSSSSRKQMEDIRTDLEKIAPPAKSRYLAVHSLSTWDNPYLTIQASMVTLHVTVADANTSSLGEGGLLRPVGARRQNLNVRTSDLPAALNAIPETAWPYGRVIAIEEAHDAPVSAEPELRRNMESVIKSLGDIGIVAYEWQEGATPGLQH